MSDNFWSSNKFRAIAGLGAAGALGYLLYRYRAANSNTDQDQRGALYSLSAYTKVSPDQVNDILSHYNLGEYVSCTELKGGLGNSNYKLVTSQGAFLLKIFEEKSLQEVKAQMDLLNVLRLHNLQVAYPIANKEGTYMIPSSAPASSISAASVINKPIGFYDFLRGANPRRATPKIMENLARAMAGLHGVPLSSVHELPDFPMGLSIMLPFLNREADEAGMSDHWFVSWLSNVVKVIQPAMKADLPQGILHGDMFLENVMFDGEEIVGMIDFEEVCRGSVVLDVAMTLVGCCYDEANNLNLELAGAYLKAYQGCRRFNELEREYFADFLLYALAAIACWRFRQFNIRVPNPDRKNSFKMMVERAASLNREVLSNLLL